MRLIDADAFIDFIRNLTKEPNGFSKVYDESAIVHFVENQPTAYDVESVVAELEKRADDNDRCADRLSGIEGKKKIASWRARAQAFRDTISIVRGKE